MDFLDYTDKDIMTFLDILSESETPDIFSIECTLAGIGAFATKKFFDTSIFIYIFPKTKKERCLRGNALKAKLRLIKMLPKLNSFYPNLIDDQ